MIADELKNWKQYPGFADNGVWKAAFEWIEKNAASATDGFHDLVDDVKIRVMEYDLKERCEARYENHAATIDLQYTIEGAEGIEVHPVDQMETDGEYLPEKDFQFYKCIGKGRNRIDNAQGSFCVLFPNDAHMPQLYVNGFTRVRKLVVKIPVSALTVEDGN